MLEFLQKNVEIVETYNKQTHLFKGELIYYRFKINNRQFLLSVNEENKHCVLTNFDENMANGIEVIATGSKNNIKEAIKKLVIRYGN